MDLGCLMWLRYAFKGLKGSWDLWDYWVQARGSFYGGFSRDA